MLAAAGWRGTPATGGAFNDPCCGSGTLAIEAAQIACGIAPGIQRRFAFERQLPYQALRADWQRMRQLARDAEHDPLVPVFASDVAFRMVDFARRNAERAGVESVIRFQGGDALERPAPELPEDMPGTLMLNPPYGDRIDIAGKAGAREGAQVDEGEDFFNRLAAHWKRQYAPHAAGWSAYPAQPRPRPAQAHAPEGKPQDADVERPDRMPVVPFRLGSRLQPQALTVQAPGLRAATLRPQQKQHLREQGP